VLWTTDPNCPGQADSLDASYIYCLFSPAINSAWGLRPPGGPGDKSIGTNNAHPVNWGMIQAMAVALDSVSVQWSRLYPNGPKIGFNDASLPWGGMFDADSTWTHPHCGHRVGIEMDHTSKNQAPLNHTQLDDANALFEDNGFIVGVEGNHTHVYYDGPGTFRGPGSPLAKVEARIKKGQ